MRTQLPYFPSLAWPGTKPQRVSALEKQLPHSTIADTFMGKQALSTEAIPHSPVTNEFLQAESTGTLRFGTGRGRRGKKDDKDDTTSSGEGGEPVIRATRKYLRKKAKDKYPPVSVKEILTRMGENTKYNEVLVSRQVDPDFRKADNKRKGQHRGTESQESKKAKEQKRREKAASIVKWFQSSTDPAVQKYYYTKKNKKFGDTKDKARELLRDMPPYLLTLVPVELRTKSASSRAASEVSAAVNIEGAVRGQQSSNYIDRIIALFCERAAQPIAYPEGHYSRIPRYPSQELKNALKALQRQADTPLRKMLANSFDTSLKNYLDPKINPNRAITPPPQVDPTVYDNSARQYQQSRASSYAQHFIDYGVSSHGLREHIQPLLNPNSNFNYNTPEGETIIQNIVELTLTNPDIQATRNALQAIPPQNLSPIMQRLLYYLQNTRRA
jgi:hypothetical protein